MATEVAVGVDNGGTWIRIKAFNSQGRLIWSSKKPSPTVEQLPSFLKKHLKRFHGHLSSLAIGSRGVWKQAKRQALARALRPLAKKVIVMSDVEAAWVAAFHSHKPREGILVISGTGSIGFGRKADGTYARAGGLGPDKGDEGSGYWIGREWLSRTKVKNRRKLNIRETARMTVLVARRAKAGNPTACDIIREAQGHLADLAASVAQQLKWKKAIPLAWAGSVLDDPWFRKGFKTAVARHSALLEHPPIWQSATRDAASALARSSSDL